MKKVLLSVVAVAVLVVSFAGIASAAPMTPAQFCKNGGAELVSSVLEDALYTAHGAMVDINVSQGACTSTLATHMNPNGAVNTQALAISFCKQIPGQVLDYYGWNLNTCAGHVGPQLGGIFHPS